MGSQEHTRGGLSQVGPGLGSLEDALWGLEYMFCLLGKANLLFLCHYWDKKGGDAET